MSHHNDAPSSSAPSATTEKDAPGDELVTMFTPHMYPLLRERCFTEARVHEETITEKEVDHICRGIIRNFVSSWLSSLHVLADRAACRVTINDMMRSTNPKEPSTWKMMHHFVFATLLTLDEVDDFMRAVKKEHAPDDPLPAPAIAWLRSAGFTAVSAEPTSHP